MLDAATTRINSKCGRVFAAAGDSTRYYDPSENIYGNELILDQDLSYITSVVNGDSVNVTTELYTRPRNETPFYCLGFKTSANSTWTHTTDVQNAISVTGRFAWMEREAITAIVRSTNVVTATVSAPFLSVGAYVYVVGIADTSFNGTFTVLTNTGAAITWAQTAANDTDTTGYILYTPTDIISACRRLAAWMYRQKDTQQGDSDRPIL